MSIRKPKLVTSPAALTIDFLIVGGGIAGLACAIALRRVGHRVLLLEQDDGNDIDASGSRMPPNMSKVLLNDWGLEEQMKGYALSCPHIVLLTYETGEIFYKHRWAAEVMTESGGEFMVIRHVDLRRILKEKAISLGAELRYNAKVATAMTQSSWHDKRPCVVLDSGEMLHADVIITAEGRYSKIREEVLHQQDSRPPTGLVLLGATIAVDKIQGHRDLKIFSHAAEKDTSLFIYEGDRRGAMCFPTGGGEDLAILIWAPDDRPENEREDKLWVERTKKERVLALLGKCDPKLRTLVEVAGDAFSMTNVMGAVDFEQWRHYNAPIMALGDAAHPTMAGSLYPSSLAVEDAVCLAQMFSHLTRHDQIPSFLDAVQEIRHPRIVRIRVSDELMLRQILFPSAADATIEDAQTRTGTMSETGETVECTPMYEDLLEVFAYEAEDAANDWWVQWGMLYERANQKDVGSLNIVVGHSVSQVVQ